MGVIDLENLLKPIDAWGDVCGEDLEYDPAFGQLERTAQGKPEQQMGDEVVPAEDPSWKDVQKEAIELLGRTKDLRVVMHLTRALVHTNGFLGLADGLSLLKGLLDAFWDTFHPRLDPDDDNDPTMRVNILVTLCDRDAFVRAVRSAPLVSSKALGRFGMIDIEIAKGEAPAPSGVEVADMTTIDAAFLDCDLEELQATAEAATRSAEIVTEIDALLTEKVGVAQAADFSPLAQELKTASGILAEQLARRGVTVDGATDEEAAVAGGEAPQRIAGEVGSREDVIRMLDKVCDYYSRNEPSSPVPMLLQRAKRLVSKSFMDIMRDLAPDGVSQVEVVGGGVKEASEATATVTVSGTESESESESGSGSDSW